MPFSFKLVKSFIYFCYKYIHTLVSLCSYKSLHFLKTLVKYVADFLKLVVASSLLYIYSGKLWYIAGRRDWSSEHGRRQRRKISGTNTNMGCCRRLLCSGFRFNNHRVHHSSYCRGIYRMNCCMCPSLIITKKEGN